MTSTMLVTGGASGIGRRIATYFNDRDWSVTAHYHSSGGDANSLPDSIRTIQADLTTTTGCERLIESYNERADNLDLLVNNAALYRRGDPTEFNAEDWTDQMNLNARAPYQLSLQCAGKLMTDGAAVVNLTDARYVEGSGQHIPYSASKAALDNLTRSLAQSLGPDIRVNAVAPGPVDFPESYSEEQQSAVVDTTVLGRAGAKDEIARAVFFLATEATYTTGSTLEVDGGQHLT